MKAPAFQFYPGDWRRDLALQGCSMRARGLWHEMLCLMHDGTPYGHLASPEGAPTPRQLSRMVGHDYRQLVADLAELETAGVFSRTTDGVIYSRRMVRDHRLREQRVAWGALGGHDHDTAVAYGQLGGRPRKGVIETPLVGVSENPVETPPAFASASASAKKEKSNVQVGADLHVDPPEGLSPPKAGRHRPEARTLLDFLNAKTGRSYRPVPANLALLEARLASGATPDQIRGVIARKVREWGGDPKMRAYLRPATLFGATKFEQYLGERGPDREGEA